MMISSVALRRCAATCVAIMGWAVCVAASGAEGSADSARPVRLVVPTAAGGGTDTLARIVAPKLGEALGQQWVVDNRAGAAGNIGSEIVVRAAPDGRTVLLAFSTILTANPSLYQMPFNVQQDLQPITMLDSAQFLLLLHPSVQARTLKDFIALAKEKPGLLNYASSGVGGPAHLAAELFMKRSGVKMVHIAYKGGTPSVRAVLSGETQVLFGSVTESLPNVKAGRLKALATTGANRSDVLPEVQTIAELGFPGFEFSKWDALLVPAKTPAGIVKRLRDAAVRALEHPDVRQAMSRQGLETKSSTPQELAERIKRETAVWATVIKDAGIHVK